MEYVSNGIILNASSSCATVITNNVQVIPNTIKEKIAILVSNKTPDTSQDLALNTSHNLVSNASDDAMLKALQDGIVLHNKEYVVFELPSKIKEIDNIIEILREQGIMYATICNNNFTNNKNPLIKLIKKFLNKYKKNNNNIKSSLIDAGIFLIHPNNITGTDIAPCGLLTTPRPSSQNVQDIASGIFILNSLCRTNTGQSAISQLGKVIGIETEIENTEHLIQRCINSKLDKKGGVLIKTTKPKQKENLIFPTIDSNTILKAKEAKLDGIVINANYCRIIDINNTIKLANKKNIFILSI